MLLKFICCDVFTRIACQMISRSPHIIDVEFVPMLAHVEPDKLREDLQRRIDEAIKVRPYEAILLGYGLCGNAIKGLSAPIPMIIPRMHDCCTMFMGSKEAFQENFGELPSTRWCSNGYYERTLADKTKVQEDHKCSHKYLPEYIGLVEKYGVENADYVWDMMHPEIETSEAIYIMLDQMEYSSSQQAFQKEVEASGKQVKTVQGSTRLMRQLVDGEWDEKQFLKLLPPQKIVPLYDMEKVIQGD